MKKISLALIVLFLISACGGKVNTAVPISTEGPAVASEVIPKFTPVCISSDPTQDDIDRALTYPGELFNAPEWERSYTVAEGRVSVTWFNNPLSSIAYIESLIFPCTYEELDLDNFFNDENWQIIFANYASFEAISECKTNDGIRLYQFKAIVETIVDTTVQTAEYAVNYWAQNDTDTRVIGTMIVFPVESQSLMDEYSDRLFPQLVSCSQ